MELVLSAVEARIVGALIEKEVTTPEYYPLTLNALKSACNQKSNRHPVMTLDDKTLVRALDSLRQRKVVWEKLTAGSRTPKYEQHLDGLFAFHPSELAVVCVLLLRGPQTAGEIKTRTARLHEFGDISEVNETLRTLADHEDGQFVVELPLQPGRREPRFMHLFCGEVDISAEEPEEPAAIAVRPDDERLEALEAEVAQLRSELDALNAAFRDFKAQFE